MPQLDRIILINSAGFDYLEFPVGGHGQVIGVNGHGKSTVLRTILFFYLGSNDKAPYALHETKSDFVSHYLGDPPSYLIYEVKRGNGSPSFHIAVTRPAGRIQFHFVDSPYCKDYYLEGKFVQSVEGVHERLREAKCAFDTKSSYEEFSNRIYGSTHSPYSVFKPSARNVGQIGVLPRIISGIFTVSQLDADKLKTALTCGVHDDAFAMQLDLLKLKSQLENFRRVHKAVKTYLKHEADALELLDLAQQFDEAGQERKAAIEDLVRMAKCIPTKLSEVKAAQEGLRLEREQEANQFQSDKAELDLAIINVRDQLAVVLNTIKKGEEASQQYQQLDIAKKARALLTLPQMLAEKHLAEEEYRLLTANYEGEAAQRNKMLETIEQTWSALAQDYARQKSAINSEIQQHLDALDQERGQSIQSVNADERRAKLAFEPRIAQLAAARTQVNKDFRSLGELKDPDEYQKVKTDLYFKEQKQRDEVVRQTDLRGKIKLAKQRRTTDRADIDRKAEEESKRIQCTIDELDAKSEQA
ncbi:MAG: ATP-binding protein, partial [Verrucomicrobiales bacterium]|nr:ATP-binding protein [Verrucomicrobiales bacterium]